LSQFVAACFVLIKENISSADIFENSYFFIQMFDGVSRRSGRKSNRQLSKPMEKS
jgi:hypothetical protein